MSFNSTQYSYQSKLSKPQNQVNVINNPALHYQSNHQSALTNKTTDKNTLNINPPSSMNQNFLNTTPKFNQQRFSPFHAQKKQDSWKTSEMMTAKSMMFMGNEKQSASNFNAKNSFGGLGKLQSMARKVQKNFDDSKDVNFAKQGNSYEYLNKFQEEKHINKYEKLNHNFSTTQPNFKKNFLNVPEALSSKNMELKNQKLGVYSSFINPSYQTNEQANKIPKVSGMDFLMKFRKQQQQKKQNQTKLKQNDKVQEEKGHYDKSSNVMNKNLLITPQNEHHRLFHEYSAPNLRHMQKNMYQGNGSNQHQSSNYFHQYQSPHHSNSNNLNSNSVQSKNDANIYKYSSPQAPTNSFMKKFNSDKADYKTNNQKTSYNSPLNLNTNSNNGKVLNFSKKFKKFGQEQSLATTQQNTPVKQKDKLVVTPAFFKNRQNKVYSQTKADLQINLNNKNQKQFNKQKLNTQYDYPDQQSPCIKSTFSSDGSQDSLEYMYQDFKQITQKEWSLNDFQLGDKLGKGAFGDVFVAREKNLGFMCVLKKMSKKRIKDQKREEHVIRQLKIQMYLNHKHLTAMYGYFHDKQSIYLILQYLPDGNLAQIKRKKKSSEKQTAEIIKQVCQGLSHMHQRNIIHRDIKPQNIFVNQGYMKLGDFGCSVFTDGLRKTVVSCLQYSSPEQLSNGYYNQKIDVWGVGILAFQLLTGRSPYENKIISAGQQGIENIDFSDLRFPEQLKISDYAKDFISSLLNVDPIDRLDMDQALDHKFITSNTHEVVSIQ